jgi:hypothetical protein
MSLKFVAQGLVCDKVWQRGWPGHIDRKQLTCFKVLSKVGAKVALDWICGKHRIKHVYRLGIWLIAVAFVFNGATSYAKFDLPVAPGLVAHGHDSAQPVCHDAHSNHTGNNTVTAADHDQAAAHSHSNLQCCGICSVASVLPDVVAIAVPFSYAAVMFYTGQRDLIGHFVALDPGIPKTSV